MHRNSIKQLSQGLRNKAFSCVELVQHYLANIKRHDNLNTLINVMDEGLVLSAAEKADQQLLSDPNANVLTGIPLAHKDNIFTHHLPTTCATKQLCQFQAPTQADIVNDLEQAGCILLGKTNLDEFGMGATNENSFFGPALNPWHHSYVPGGSSGGAAASVAARLVPFSTGTDTGGSIREPAAWCGITGLKPTKGLLSNRGVVPLAPTLDQVGPMACSAEDIAFVLNAIGSLAVSLEGVDLKGLRIGVPSFSLNPSVHQDIRIAFERAIKVFEKAGAQIVPITIKLQPLWLPCYYILCCTEATLSLSQFYNIETHGQDLGIEVRRRLVAGSYLLSPNHISNDVYLAHTTRLNIKQELLDVFRDVDIMLSPTTANLPTKLASLAKTPQHRRSSDQYTAAVNLAGLPALSIPAGFSQKHGLPIGIQCIGPHQSDARLLQIAHKFQQDTDWHQKVPPGCD